MSGLATGPGGLPGEAHRIRFYGHELINQRLAIDGIEFGLVCGPGHDSDKQNLVLVHGLGCRWTFWRHNLDAFLADYNIFLFDLPWSSYAPCTFKELDDLLVWTGKVFMQAAVDSPVVVAHSYGAAVVLNLAMRGGAGFARRLVLSSIIWPQIPTKDNWVERRRHLIGNFENFLYRGVTAGLRADADPVIAQDILAKVIKLCDRDSVLGYWDLLFDRHHRIETGFNIPALVIVGCEDDIVPVADSYQLCERLDSFEYLCLEDSQHFPMIERKEDFHAFIQRYSSATA